MKMVIVMRTDLGMTPGKMIAQGCHAAVAVVMQADREKLNKWTGEGGKKVVVGVHSEKELLEVFINAKQKKILTRTVKDAGKTEVRIGTYTCCAIGPADDKEVDAVTGALPLL